MIPVESDSEASREERTGLLHRRREAIPLENPNLLKIYFLDVSHIKLRPGFISNLLDSGYLTMIAHRVVSM